MNTSYRQETIASLPLFLSLLLFLSDRVGLTEKSKGIMVFCEGGMQGERCGDAARIVSFKTPLHISSLSLRIINALTSGPKYFSLSKLCEVEKLVLLLFTSNQ